MTGLAVGLAVAAGLAGAVQAAVMGELGGRAGVFPALAFSGVVSVVIGLALLLIARQSVRGLADVRPPAALALDRRRALRADHPGDHRRFAADRSRRRSAVRT